MKRATEEKQTESGQNSAKKGRQQEYLSRYGSEPGICPSSLGKSFAHCSYCRVDISIVHGGKNDIDKHCKTKSHRDRKETRQAAATCQGIQKFMPAKTVQPEEQGAVRAEAMFTEMIAKLNLPLTTADTISKVMKSAFPDSEIAKKYECGRSKATAIINSMAKDIKDNLRLKIQSGPFCVSTDGSNDQREKQYPVVITTVGESGIITELLSVPTLDLQMPSTGVNIFNLLKEQLAVPPDENATVVGDQPSVPWDNCLALGCDNAAVMTGHKNGVYAYMKEKQPALHLSGCPCHLLHRAGMKAASELPFSIEEILVDVYYYMEHSSKRLAALETFQEEVQHHKILKHVSTRWLSVRRCLARLLENWDALKQFLREETAPASSTAMSRRERLKTFFTSRTNKLYCLFLLHALHPFDIVNQKLQNESPQVHTLQRTLLELLHTLLVRFVKPVIIAETTGNPARAKTPLEVNFKNDNNLKRQVLLSDEAEKMLKNKDKAPRDEKVKEFHENTRKFYKAACVYMREKLPLRDELLSNAEVADVDQRLVVTDENLVYFLHRFPCLLPPTCSIDVVKSEFAVYQSHVIIPTLKKDRIDETWVAIGQAKDAAGVFLFANLAQVMLGILTIPHSNAGCERVFSCVRKNKTEQRASLSSKTVDSLMVVKSRPGLPQDRNYSKEELVKLKSAYYTALHKKDCD